MGLVALKPSRAVGRLLRQRRKDLRLSLQAVSNRLKEKGEGIPVSTLARIERGELDPGVRRLHALLRLYQVRPHLVADLVELEALAVEPPVGRNVKELFNEGLKHWRAGDIPKGLAFLFATRDAAPESAEDGLVRQNAILAFAIAARDLGKTELAHQLVEDLLREPPVPTLRVNVLVLAADLWNDLGSLDAALGLLSRAEAVLDRANARQVAWVSHQKARLLIEAADYEDAETALSVALDAYRATKDEFGEIGGLLLRVRGLAARGLASEALVLSREVLERAEAASHRHLALYARIYVGSLLVETGECVSGIETLSDALANAMLLKDRNGQFLSHYHRWKAFGRAGDDHRERLELESAQYFVRFVDDASAEANEIRKTLTSGGAHDNSAKARSKRGP